MTDKAAYPEIVERWQAIKYMIEPGSIEWEMDWSQKKADGSRQYPDQPDKEMIFEKDNAIAHLIINKVVFLNSHHWEKDWPEKARKATSLNVNCNDIFAWGTADDEEITMDGDEVEKLYRMWKDNPIWGPALWCMIKRREMPQTPVADAMRKEGVDLDAFQKENNIRENFGNGLCLAMKNAGVKWDDEGYGKVRAQFIEENGWEGDVK